MAVKLKTCLEALPAARREMLACRLPGSSADSESLAQVLTAPQNVRKGWERIGETARRLLLELVRFTPGWTAERDMGRFLRCVPSFCEIRRAMDVLHREGWLFAARGEGNERVRVVPDEVRKALMNLWLEEFCEACPEEAEIFPSGAGNAGLGQAFFHFLTVADLQMLPVTAAGRLALREAQKLDVELELDSAAFAGTKWESEGGLPAWIAFLAETAEVLGLAGAEGGRFTVRRDRFAAWLNQPYPVMVSRLHQTVRDLFVREIPESGGFWLMLESLGPDRWIGLGDWAFPAVAERGIRKRREPEHTAAWEKAAAFLEAAGWLWIGIWGGKIYVRTTGEPPWTDAWPEDPSLFLDPGMELLIPCSFPLRDRYELAKMADYMGGERMLHYVMTPSSVRRALRHGLDAETIEARLSVWTRSRLPEWASERIGEWTENARGIRLEEAVLIRTDEADDADHVKRILKSKGWTVKKVGESWAVAGASAEAVKRILEGEGLEAERVTGPLPPADPDEDWPGVRRRFRVEAAKAEGVDPDEVNLPKIWTAGLRKYPPGLVREILQKSADARFDVLAEIRGTRRLLSPQRCIRQSGEWVLEAREKGRKAEFPLAEIGRIQIVLEQKTEELAGDFL